MMESASLLALAGALPPLPFGLTSVDMIGDEKPGCGEINAYESQSMMLDTKMNAVWSERSRRGAGVTNVVNAVVHNAEVRNGRKL